MTAYLVRLFDITGKYQSGSAWDIVRKFYDDTSLDSRNISRDFKKARTKMPKVVEHS